MNDTIYTNIKSLLQVREPHINLIKGLEMNDLPSIDQAWLWIENGIIKDFGTMKDLPEVSVKTKDCTGCFILPTFVDPHTHLVFAKTREEEFEMRIKGFSYEEIAAAGGGIINSAKRLRLMDEAKLFDDAWLRLEEVMKTGTGAIEIKSGYGLNTEGELKMLKVIKKLKEKSPIPIKSTFLGAHAFPPEHKDNHEAYIKLIIDDMLPKIVDEGLADYIDVFCERGYFNVAETQRILEAGAKFGLKPKIHVNQFSISGGVQIGVKMKALSVDHLEIIGNEEIDILKNSNTIPTLLPSCSFFLGIPYAPARKLLEANIAVALGTDYNPGSTPSGNIPFLLSLACIKLKMTPYEALNATTINAASALELEKEYGSITRGKKAHLIITEPMPNIAFWMYSFGKGNTLIKEITI